MSLAFGLYKNSGRSDWADGLQFANVWYNGLFPVHVVKYTCLKKYLISHSLLKNKKKTLSWAGAISLMVPAAWEA